ncbi:head GIN domain-containing protein [uncultured Capnocytophaga sp.]|uniref:head GIN domain-containing protein n=1 Tax=uncultured Capnocytophaga sp. TaxID=159273 RepID=UPI00260AF08B|nr:head GIN domain-containing protein [uncultured Capnocytophaga sp.]
MRTIKNLFLQSFFLLLSCCRPVIGNKKIVFQERTIPIYSQIKVLGNADIVLTEGNIGQITVETSENVLPYVATEVKGETLVVKLKHYGVNYVPKLKIYVPIDEKFNKITIAGKGDVTLGEHFSIELQTLEVTIKGQGNVQLQGKTEVLKVSVLGSGNFQGKELLTRKGTLSISGTANIEASVSEEVQAKITGYGHIIIFGNPSKKDTDIRGSGKIQFL